MGWFRKGTTEERIARLQRERARCVGENAAWERMKATTTEFIDNAGRIAEIDCELKQLEGLREKK